jgi:protein involved in polysaccharide export with SLBB domain
LIRPGDVLSIPPSGGEWTGQLFTVRPDGTIFLPGLGEIKAAGLTPFQLRGAIVGRLAGRVTLPTIQKRDK